MDGKRQKTQYQQSELAFMAELRGEPPQSRQQGTEPPLAKREPERPVANNRLMEEVCERENLKKAWKRVRANKGGPGVDGMTVDELPDYLREH